MARSDELLSRLRTAIDELADSELETLLAEARTEARVQVRSLLSEALAHSMLDRIGERLESPSPFGGQAPAPELERAAGTAGELATYVYGVIDADAPLPAGVLTGVDASHPVEAVVEGELAAVVSSVALEHFDEERLRAHLADMAWVERTARAHEAVLETLCGQETVIPMRMCTVYRTEGGVRELLRREAGRLLDALRALDGKAEWGIKVFADPTAATIDDGVIDAAEPSGTAYLNRRRLERDHAERLAEQVEQAAVEIHERLCALADDGLVAPPQRPEASGHAAQMVLNGAYLVREGARERFGGEVQALQVEYLSLGLWLERTGPWPAYNFVPGAIGTGW